MKSFQSKPRLIQLSLVLLLLNFLAGVWPLLQFPNFLATLPTGWVLVFIIPFIANLLIFLGLFLSKSWALIAIQVFWLLQSVGIDTENWGLYAQTGLNFFVNFGIDTETGKLVFLFNLFAIAALVIARKASKLYSTDNKSSQKDASDAGASA